MSDPDVRAQLDQIERDAAAARQHAESADANAAAALAEARLTNGRLQKVEQTLHGPEDRAGRWQGGGLVDNVAAFKRWVRERLDQHHQEVDDVARHATGQSAADLTRRRTWKLAAAWAAVLVGAVSAAAAVVKVLG